MARRMELDGRTALITGAGSGIGRAVAVSLARRGCTLALPAVNEPGPAQTAQEIGAAVRVTRYLLDVSDPEAIAGAPQRVLADHPGVDVLVNNAGVALGGAFEQVSAADFEWLFSINFWGVVRMTRAFLPTLRKSPDARLVNLSSIFGIIAPPGQSAYAASKFAVRGFSESLRHELKTSSVGLTVVHPGGVATSIARNARLPAGASAADMERRLKFAEAKLTLSPTVAGETIVRAVERRRPRLIVGLDAKIAVAAEHFAPVSYWKLLGRGMTP